MGRALTVATRFTGIDQTTSVAKKIGASVSGMGRTMAGVGRAASRMGGLIRTAVVGLAMGAAGKAIVNFSEKGDAINRLAGQLGMNAEAFQELSYAAKIADIESEDFANATKKMNNNLGQLKTKQGSLYTLLARTNPQLAMQLRNVKSSDEAFTLLMDSISKETNVQKRAALAQAAFGKTGQNLISMADDLAARRKEAHSMGGVISQEDLDGASAFDESLKKVKVSLGGISASVFGKITASLAPMLDKFNAWVNANKDFIGQKIDTVFKIIGDVFTQLGPSIVRIVEMLLPAISQIIEKALPIFVSLLESLLPILPPLLDLLSPVLDLVIALAPAFKAVAELIKAVLVPVLMILKPILEMISALIKPIVAGISWVAEKAGGFLGPLLGRVATAMGNGPAAAGARAAGAQSGLASLTGGLGPISPNAGLTSTERSESLSKVQLDIGKLPEGYSARLRPAPQNTLPTGFAFAGASGGSH